VHRYRHPPPSRTAERLREYLDIIEPMQAKHGHALWYDIYRRAENPYQTDSTIKYLEENGLIEGNKTDGYRRTKKGESWHEILRKHRDLVGVLTRELSGDRQRRW
jgi:Mn-dependent DtxR family transcriptional regulator